MLAQMCDGALDDVDVALDIVLAVFDVLYGTMRSATCSILQNLKTVS